MNMLKIELPASAEDDSLKKINEIRIEAKSSLAGEDSTQSVFELRPSNRFGGRITGDGYFIDDLGTDIGKVLNPLPLYPRTSIGDYFMFINRKDFIEDIRFGLNSFATIDLSELSYCLRLHHIVFEQGRCYGDISALKRNSQIWDFVDIRSSQTYGDVGVFSNCTLLTTLRLNATQCTGVLDVGKSIYLEVLSINGSAGITADFDAIADDMFAGGRTSGTMTTVNVSGVIVTYSFSSGGWTKA